ncbi:DEAD/DEAH box helicase, partial [Rhizobium hidalgonense]|nr:DEAD/DEAH box helicase [Rhizobium hidalgonense]
LVQEFYPNDDEQRLYELVSEYLQSPDLYALPASQRQLMTLILRRLLASSTYAISGTLAGLAKKLEGIVDEHTYTEDDIDHNLLELVDNFETFDELADEYDGDGDGDGDGSEEDVDEKTYTAQDISKIKVEII